MGQYIVIYSEKYGVDAALQEEARINATLHRKTGSDIRERYPLFESIFPAFQDANDYAADAE